MSARTDEAECLAILRDGSKSFHAASLLLPPRIRGSVAAVYAFCRVSDDAVDRDRAPAAALARQRERLHAAYAGAPEAHAVDRALAAAVRRHDIPRAPFDFMLEGFAWDVEQRRYETIDGLVDYAVRVASTVGVIMTVIMGDRRAAVLERACDLGIAMQLTNVARDVGEDARAGRLYLPIAWLRDAGIDPDAFVADPRFSWSLGDVVRRLLARADEHYASADVGIAMLPRDSRIAIEAARRVYAEIGRAIGDASYDSVTRRAVTSGKRKAWLLARALPVAVTAPRTPDERPRSDLVRETLGETRDVTPRAPVDVRHA